MKRISSMNLSEEEMVEFFRTPISYIKVGALEDNRVFELQFSSSCGSMLLIYSDVYELSDGDEIGIISGKFIHQEIDGSVLEFISPKITSLHNIIGIIDNDIECLCGIVVEADDGIHSIVAGSFPASINIISPIFNQSLKMNSFQPFKYYSDRIFHY
jgi:hypothetical protein